MKKTTTSLYEVSNSGKTVYVKLNVSDHTATLYKKNSSNSFDEFIDITFSEGNPACSKRLCNVHHRIVSDFIPFCGNSTFYPLSEMKVKNNEPRLGVEIFDNSKIAILAIKIGGSVIDISAPWQIFINYTTVPVKNFVNL